MEVKLICNRCNATFVANTGHLRSLGLKAVPKRCPTCLDVIQGRPEQAIIVSRGALQEWDGVRIDIPQEWFGEFRATIGDRSCRRAVVKGAKGAGVAWQGRLDIYDFRPDASLPGRVRLMRAQHRTGEVSFPDPEKGWEEERRYSDTYEYLCIDPTDAQETCALVWAQVNFKMAPERESGEEERGSQYIAALDTSRAIWAYRFSSIRVRNGKYEIYGSYGSFMALAIVDDSHPVTATIRGDNHVDLLWTYSYIGEEVAPIDLQEGTEEEWGSV